MIDWNVLLPIIITGAVSAVSAYVAAQIRNRSPEVKAAVEQTATAAAMQVVAALQVQVNGLQDALDEERTERRKEREVLQTEINQLRQENVTLRGQVQALQLENDTLKSGNGNGKPRGGLGRR